MSVLSNVRRFVFPVIAVAAAGTVGAMLLGAAADDRAAKFNDKGALIRPEGYRKWVFIGCPVTPNDMNNGKAAFPEFHHVYIDPKSFAHYEKTGQFPEGTVIVKELANVATKESPSGAGYFPGDFVLLAVAVKSAKRFPNEPGNWGYFNFGEYPNYAETAEVLPTDSCNGCHQAGAEQDYVFTQFYPVLRAAHQGKEMEHHHHGEHGEHGEHHGGEK
jgi:hypothetical protein